MRRFRIPSISPTTSKCIRFSNDIIEKIEDAIKDTNCTFSSFITETVRVTLYN